MALGVIGVFGLYMDYHRNEGIFGWYARSQGQASPVRGGIRPGLAVVGEREDEDDEDDETEYEYSVELIEEEVPVRPAG